MSRTRCDGAHRRCPASTPPSGVHRPEVDATVLRIHSTEWSPPGGVPDIVRERTTPTETMPCTRCAVLDGTMRTKCAAGPRGCARGARTDRVDTHRPHQVRAPARPAGRTHGAGVQRTSVSPAPRISETSRTFGSWSRWQSRGHVIKRSGLDQAVRRGAAHFARRHRGRGCAHHSPLQCRRCAPTAPVWCAPRCAPPPDGAHRPHHRCAPVVRTRAPDAHRVRGGAVTGAFRVRSASRGPAPGARRAVSPGWWRCLRRGCRRRASSGGL